MPPLGLPRLSIEPVLALPLWLGTLRDSSGYGHHGDVPLTNPYWRSRGGTDLLTGSASRYIEVDDSAVLRAVVDNTLFVRGQFRVPATTRPVFNKRFGADTQISHRITQLGTLNVYDGVTQAEIALGNLSAIDTIAVSLVSGNAGNVYVNGVLIGALDNTNTIAPEPVNIFIGEAGFDLSMVIWYPGVLAAPEISDLHLWSKSRITPRKQWPGSGLRYPGRTTDLLVDGDMEEAGVAAWVAGNDADLTKETTDPFEGIQLLRVTRPGATINPYAAQAIMTIGEQYHLMIQVRGDGGTGFPIVYDTAVELGRGTTANVWQSLDVTFVATSTALVLLTGAAGAGDYSEWDAAELWTGYTPRTGDPLFLDNIQTARVTLADQTSGRLSNTPYQIESGSWALKEDVTTGERYIECVVAGIIARRNLFARGTLEFDVEKGGGTNSLDLLFSVVAPTDWADSAQNGYMYQFSSTERAVLRRITAGVSTPIAMSDAAYVVNNQRYKIRISVSTAGVFTAYIMGGTFANWTLVSAAGGGSNPVTDNTHTTSVYAVFVFDAGDRLYLDRQFAGVLAPV